jgi:hypothetical protein
MSIDILVGNCAAFSPEQSNLGGSEQSLLSLAAIWNSKYKYKVRIIIDENSFGPERTYNGIEFIHPQNLFSEITNGRKTFDIMILWRFCGINLFIEFFSAQFFNSNFLCADLHDDMNDFNSAFPYKFKLLEEQNCTFCFKSNFHSTMKFARQLRNKFVCINGISFVRTELISERQKNRFCYTASYARGLKELLQFSWPLIKMELLDAELHVYYGLENVENGSLRKEIETLLLTTNGVFHHGTQDIRSIALEKKLSTFFLYPCNTEQEIDCINVRESCWYGCIPIISNLAVFSERVGVKVIGDPNLQDFHQKYAEKCIELAKLDLNELAELRSVFYNESLKQNHFYSWNYVGNVWNNLFLQRNVNKTIEEQLCFFMERYNSDKGPKFHNYSYYYNLMFQNKRERVLNVFEMGIGTSHPDFVCNMTHVQNYKSGASLRAWKEYFPNSTVYSFDICKEAIFLARCDRILTFYCNQLDSQEIKDKFKFFPMFDIMIDDGFHDFHANVCLFDSTINHLRYNGIYIIEDIKDCQVELFKVQLQEWKKKYTYLQFKLLNIPNLHDTKNYIIIILYENSITSSCQEMLRNGIIEFEIL